MNSVIKIPKPIADNLDELMKLCEEFPLKIPLTQVAEFLGADDEGLRSAAEKGQLPFGFAWQKNIRGNRAFCIPTVTFYLWYTQSAAFRV